MPATGDAVNVKVALRCRPLSKKELSEGDRSIFEKDGNVARLQDPDGRQNGGSPIEFGFDHVYDADSTQLQVYEDVGKPVVDAAFQGFNTTVFAYGQTGSGKSWSMTGGKDEQRGLIPRINAEIFERIENSSEEKLYLVQCSYFEIYNEIVGDSASVSERFRSSSCVFTKPRRRDAVDGAVRASTQFRDAVVRHRSTICSTQDRGRTRKEVAASRSRSTRSWVFTSRACSRSSRMTRPKCKNLWTSGKRTGPSGRRT